MHTDSKPKSKDKSAGKPADSFTIPGTKIKVPKIVAYILGAIAAVLLFVFSRGQSAATSEISSGTTDENATPAAGSSDELAKDLMDQLLADRAAFQESMAMANENAAAGASSGDSGPARMPAESYPDMPAFNKSMQTPYDPSGKTALFGQAPYNPSGTTAGSGPIPNTGPSAPADQQKPIQSPYQAPSAPGGSTYRPSPGVIQREANALPSKAKW